jgi:peptidoglycan hydrolase-like protein with peptidoglycan-binding domain
MKRLLVATSAAVAVVASAAGLADAGPPANQGCYGESISALARNQAAPGAFGHAVVGFAQDPGSRPGLGDGVQLLQAGLVPDEVVPNTCND